MLPTDLATVQRRGLHQDGRAGGCSHLQALLLRDTGLLHGARVGAWADLQWAHPRVRVLQRDKHRDQLRGARCQDRVWVPLLLLGPRGHRDACQLHQQGMLQSRADGRDSRSPTSCKRGCLNASRIGHQWHWQHHTCPPNQCQNYWGDLSAGWLKGLPLV